MFGILDAPRLTWIFLFTSDLSSLPFFFLDRKCALCLIFTFNTFLLLFFAQLFWNSTRSSRYDGPRPERSRQDMLHPYLDESVDGGRNGTSRNENEPQGHHRTTDVWSSRCRHQRLDGRDIFNTLEENTSCSQRWEGWNIPASKKKKGKKRQLVFAGTFWFSLIDLLVPREWSRGMSAVSWVLHRSSLEVKNDRITSFRAFHVVCLNFNRQFNCSFVVSCHWHDWHGQECWTSAFRSGRASSGRCYVPIPPSRPSTSSLRGEEKSWESCREEREDKREARAGVRGGGRYG